MVLDTFAKFVGRVIDLELKVVTSNYQGDTKFDKLVADFYKLVGTPHVMQMVKIDLDNEDDLGREANENTLKSLAPRTLFMVKRFATPSARLVAYVGMPERQRLEPYGEQWWFDGDHHLIARYVVCGTCFIGKVVKGKPCPDCRGLGFVLTEGQRMDDVGPPVEIKKLVAPTNPKSLADYDAA